MLTELCKELNNYFDIKHYYGEFTIADGALVDIDYLQEGQYFRIVGSVFNDGVYQYPATELKDEVFDGAIWAMAIPSEVIALADDIDAWTKKYQSLDSSAMSPFTSESFGGYSYSKGSGSSSGNGGGVGNTWQGVFANRLNKWRKIRP